MHKVLKYLHNNKIKYNISNDVVTFKLPKETPMNSKEPQWFKSFREENDRRWEEQDKINNSEPEWFKSFREENDRRWEEQDKINRSEPKWFKDWLHESQSKAPKWFENFESKIENVFIALHPGKKNEIKDMFNKNNS